MYVPANWVKFTETGHVFIYKQIYKIILSVLLGL